MASLDMRRLVKEEIDRRQRMVAQKNAAEVDLMAYVRMIWPIIEPNTPLVEGWVLDLLADVMMAVSDGEMNRVCINVPPGSMKSTLLNVCLPSWLWGPCNRPSMRFLSISYSDRVPVRDNLRFADVVKHPVYQKCWGDRVKIARDGAEWVSNNQTGWKAVTSVTGSTTGLRADILLLDDLNNPGSVESELVRYTTNRFVREIMPTRINDVSRSAIINLQQRTHQHDATGTLIEYGQDYTFVCVPAEFDPLRICRFTLREEREEEDEETGEIIVIPEDVWIDPRSLDENGRQLRGLSSNKRGEPVIISGSPMAKAQGESFWPERFPEEELLRLKTTLGPYGWDSQFNQVPGVRGGAIIHRDWWKTWLSDDYPEIGTVVVSLDTAIELKETNDYNAVTAWGAFEGENGEPQFLLLEAWRDRLPLADLARRVAETCRSRRADYLVIEHKTRGRDVHDEIVRLYQHSQWQTVLLKPDGDKVSRLKAVSHLFSGDVRKLPDGKDAEGNDQFRLDWFGGVVWAPDKGWADEVIEETAAFPYGAHDDYCDSVSQALGFARKNGVVLRKVEYDEEELARNRFKKQLRVPYSI